MRIMNANDQGVETKGQDTQDFSFFSFIAQAADGKGQSSQIKKHIPLNTGRGMSIIEGNAMEMLYKMASHTPAAM
jgi:hypothetical protein